MKAEKTSGSALLPATRTGPTYKEERNEQSFNWCGDLGVTGARLDRGRRRSVGRVTMCPRSHWSRQETFRQAPPICYMKGTRGLRDEEVLRNKWHPLKCSSSVPSGLAAPAENDSPWERSVHRIGPCDV
ncbi:hypothetical protein AMELA_G00149470 [Ameiurus melas]|uniref:Uncharacterized protein n=1 Tax=Ameiurus melas TaxID=219545 RepID=A0A7J6AH54_AMEME|nr:hypothetical protein AMELA_G00149470 [Ameiurus melas]